ncbi:MAG: hypothetical protein WC455_14005 [Dehalococcoidia bacterium]
MAIRWISTAWQNHLKTEWPQDHRSYIDFRQQAYPEIDGSPTFTLITSADNQPGSHNFTGGYATYFLDMPSSMIVDAYFKPTFAYNVAGDQCLWSWYRSATRYLKLYYQASSDKYCLEWCDGTAARTMLSSAYISDITLQVWTRLTVSINVATGGITTGSALYLNGTSIASSWSGNIDVKASYFPTFAIRALNGTSGGYTINYLRLFSGTTATAADVSNNFKNKLNEETIWHFNGHACGRTRCNVSSRTMSIDIERSVESPLGNANPNKATIALSSPGGQFADDQYAAFNAASEIYNGTSAQKYMQTRCPMEIEIWYGGLYELQFIGRIDDSMFHRVSGFEDKTKVTISANDFIDDLKRRIRQRCYSFENYDICDPASESTSLLHTIVRMESQKEWYNFLANSSFENDTIGNSWAVYGAGNTLARVGGGLQGSYQGDLVYAAAGGVYQTIDFTVVKKLNVGQKWTFYIYLKATGISSGTLRLSEYDEAVEDGYTTSAWSLTANTGWRKFEVTHTITDSTSDHLRCTISLASNVTLSMDCAHLIQNSRSLNWFILNNNDGASGEESADDADCDSYETIGFDCDDADYLHPWALIEKDVAMIEYIKEISDGTCALYMGCDPCGTFRFRTPFKTGFTDPVPATTISSAQSIDSILDIAQSNKIKIHGIKIKKKTDMATVWHASDSNSFNEIASGGIFETVADGVSWPFLADYPEYWAQYSGET